MRYRAFETEPASAADMPSQVNPSLAFDCTKPDGTPRKLMDVSRLATMGWTVRRAMREGLEETYAWFRATDALRIG